MRANVPYEIIDKQKIDHSLYVMYLRFGLEKSLHLIKCDEPINNIRKHRVIYDGSKLNLIEGSSFTRYCLSRQPVRRRKLDEISYKNGRRNNKCPKRGDVQFRKY